MPPIHPSQADVAAAYRTLIAHETEPKEQDFYRTRLQRLEQATEPVCEFDCRSRVAAAGVGVYCPQCSAKCADTDLATNLAKAIRAAWVDRLDWDELAQGALGFLTSTGRLIPAGGRGLEFSEVEALRSAWEELKDYRVDGYARPHVNQIVKVVGALFPATEPAEDGWGDMNPNDPLGRTYRETAEEYYSAPAEPAEEETKAEPSTRQIADVIVEGRSQNMSWMQIAEIVKQVFFPTSSPVVPASTETGPWQDWPSLDAIPADVRTVWDKAGDEYRRENGGWKFRSHGGKWQKVTLPLADFIDFAPFTTAAVAVWDPELGTRNEWTLNEGTDK